jgi:hypothetical protein
MKLKQLKTIDIQAKEWTDKTNGNDYWSSEITLNFGKSNSKTYTMPFSYGYDEQYLYNSLELVKNLFPKSNWFKSKWNFNKWSLFEKYGIVVNNSIKKNCLKRDLIKA